MSRTGLKPGSEADGTESPLYCGLCYDKGAFLQPTITARSMQHLVMHALQREARPRPLAWLMTRHIPRLRRWRQS